MSIAFSTNYPADVIQSGEKYFIKFCDFEHAPIEGKNITEVMGYAQDILDQIIKQGIKNKISIPEPSLPVINQVCITPSPDIAVSVMLKKIRKHLKFSVARMASLLGVSAARYARYEHGQISLATLKKISAKLNVTFEIKVTLHTSNLSSIL